MGHSVIERPSIFEREATTASLEGVLSNAGAGRGEALFLVGEAGLGKTTLLAQARVSAETSFVVGVGRADVVEATLAFGIMSQALDDLGGRGLLLDREPSVSGSDARAAHFYGVLRLLESSSKPVLLLLDDLHWADGDSLALISFLCRRIGTLPIAIIGALRPWPVSALEMAQRLATKHDARIERLEPLTESGAVALLQRQVGQPLEEVHLRLVRSLTAGNPLLLELLASSIAAGPSFTQQHLTADTDLVLARFTGGTPQEMQLARAAAIFGTTFHPAQAAALAGLSQIEADTALVGLCASGVVRSGQRGTAEFAHPLVRQTVYEHIAAPVRAGRHAAAFRILFRQGVDGAELAEHAVAGDLSGDPDAIAALERSGLQAQRLGALDTARRNLEAAVRLAGSRASPSLLQALGEVLVALGDAPAAAAICRRILGTDQLAANDRIAARRLLGRALFAGGDPPDAHREFLLAVEEAAGSSEAAAIETLLEAVYVAWPTGGPAMAAPLAQRARELAGNGPADLRLQAETASAFCAFVGGDPQGTGIIEEAARRAEKDPLSDIGAFAWTWGAIGLHGNVAKWSERFDEAERAFRVGMAAAERLQLPIAIASLAVMHGDTCARTGRLEEGLRWLDRASGLSELAPERAFWAAVAHSYILIEMGRVEEARSWAESARALADPAPTWPGWIWLCHVDAQLATHDRRHHEACAFYERIEGLADRTGILEPCVIPWMGDALGAYSVTHRYEDANRIMQRLTTSVRRVPCRIPRVVLALAEALQHDLMGQPDTARPAYERALNLSAEIPAPPLQARVLIRFGVHLRRCGDLSAARKPFAEAQQLAEAAGAEPLASRATRELAEVGGRKRQRRQNPDALTFAESRVASLAHEGLSDREIAQRLSLSVNTIETHLQHVYRKLEIRSRRELMRLDSLPLAGVAAG